MTNEGPAAIKEAIEYLQQVEPVAELEWSSGKAKACEDHVGDIAGTDSSSLLMYHDGDQEGTVYENISFGSDTAIDIVMQLFIDDGVSSRVHR